MSRRLSKEHRDVIKNGVEQDSFFRVITANSVNMPDGKTSTWVRGDLDAVKKEHIVPVANHMVKRYLQEDHDPQALDLVTDYGHGVGYVMLGKFVPVTHNNKNYFKLTTVQKPVTFTVFSQKHDMDAFWENDPHNTHFQDDVYKYNHGMISGTTQEESERFINDIMYIFEADRPDLVANAPVVTESYLLELKPEDDFDDFKKEEWADGELKNFIMPRTVARFDA